MSVATMSVAAPRADAAATTLIAVRDRGEPETRGHSVIDCVLGHHVQLAPSMLEDFNFRGLADADRDLLFLAGVISFADRMVRRGAEPRWGRSLLIRMPVLDLARWQDSTVVSALRRALSYVTGDRWRFEFVARRRVHAGQVLLALRRPPEGRLSVLPYSGGLDSFAALRLTASDGNLVPLAFTAENSTRLRSLAVATSRWTIGHYHRVRLPVRLVVGEHPERTCRARTFLFLIGAALAAKLAGAEEVQVPENGQGSIGLSAMPDTAESPYRGTHPAYTRQLHDFLRALWGTAPRFRHPHLWETKAAVLGHLQDRALLDGWRDTRSCSRTMYREKSEAGVHEQCGVCCNCLLRRIALGAVGLSGSEPYVWSDLAATTLEGALHPVRAGCGTTPRDRSIALGAVRDHQKLAEIGGALAGGPAFDQAVYEVAHAQEIPLAESAAGLGRLLRRHRADWSDFLTTLPSGSWILSIAGGG